MERHSDLARSLGCAPGLFEMGPDSLRSIPDAVPILPDGQITSDFPKPCQAPFAKIFLFALDPNQFTDSPCPVPQRGVRTSRTRGGMRWTLAARETSAACRRTVKSCRSGAPMPASSLREEAQATVSTKHGHRGEREVSRKTIARGMPGRSGVTVVTNSCVCFFTHEAAGASRARHSLRPLFLGQRIHAQLGRIAPRDRAAMFWKLGQRHCDTNAPRSQPSSPGSTGRSSIPEMAVMESRGRGLLDPPHARGMTIVARSDKAIRPLIRVDLGCFVASLLAMTVFDRHRSQ
jgi:hypothetical protein